MAAANLLTLLDDITTLLKDIALTTKATAHRTMGIVSDDIAVSAEQLASLSAKREIPVVLKVAKGSLINKALLIPVAMLISVYANGLIAPLLIAGGCYLGFEGFEKVLAAIVPKKEDEPSTTNTQPLNEAERVKGAIRTDFVLSVEIIIVSLGMVESSPLVIRFVVLCLVALGLTLGIYGLVAAIVKMDDLGLYLRHKKNQWLQRLGSGLLSAAPLLMAGISIAGTLAMFLVGGKMIRHHTPLINQLITSLPARLPESLWAGFVYDAATGMIAGAILYSIYRPLKQVIYRSRR